MNFEDLKTIFVDIDGTLLWHHEMPNQQTEMPVVVLPGVLDTIADWTMKGYQIILTTGRRESERERTIQQLQLAGIVYDKLIMGVSRGPRVIINDQKTFSDIPTAVAICVERNKGLTDLRI